jgi:two-component system, chemotaxis family, CheB/CheR fusion protein
MTEHVQEAVGSPPSGEEGQLPAIVGVGASAGGLEALEQLFHHMPADTGLAFVVIQHLSPDFESLMDELLHRQTELRIETAEDGMPVAANTIYLLPRGKEMIISGGRLHLTDKDPEQGLTLPIDHFFRSLAQDQHQRAVGIILSGTGSDGSRGIRHIHDAGGLVIVQSEESAKFNGMPRSAIASGVVDLILPPEEIGAVLAGHAGDPLARPFPEQREAVPVDEDAMQQLVRMLRESHGIDFSHYKPTTVRRRIERRLLLSQEADFEQYVEKVAADSQELNSLYHDLLIGVTQFFRDPEAFELLEREILPALLKDMPRDEEIRFWVPGCATGEEAYSLAILVHEWLTANERPVNVKIFATDVHEEALKFAGAGIYGESVLNEVTPARLERYFVRQGNDFQVRGDLRQMIVFAQHNVIKDAPFTRLHLISCRNLLIYLQPLVQKKLLSLFHFGLRTGGVLFLGPSESLGDVSDEFSTIDSHWRLYRKRRDIRLPTDFRLSLSLSESGSSEGPLKLPRATSPGLQRPTAGTALTTPYMRLLERYVPTGVLIDVKRNVVHLFGDAARLLQLRPGPLSQDLLNLIPAEFKTTLAGALHRVERDQKPVIYRDMRIGEEPAERMVTLSVEPLPADSGDLTHMLVTFEEDAVPQSRAETFDVHEVSDEQFESVQRELANTRENLQATIEELETSNEELHATNEELVASNEELQSTNEELHSVNEELYTVNAEHQRKITELSELTDDVTNLLESSNIGTIFLDSDLNIRRLTPQITRLFNIVPQDVGRSFESFTHGLERPHLLKDVRHVLQTGEAIEDEVRDRFGHWHLLRIRPYKSRRDEKGVVITLIDIDSLKRVQMSLRETDSRLQGLMDHAPAFVFVKDLDGRYLIANAQSAGIFGIESTDIVGKTDYDILPREQADELQAADRAVATSGESIRTEESAQPGQTYLAIRFPVRSDGQKITGIAGIFLDVTTLKQAEQQARSAVRERDRFLAMLSHEFRNPLGAIRNAVTYLERDGADQSRVDLMMDVLSRQTRQLTRLTDDLLDVSRIAQGRIEIRPRLIDLRQVTEDAAEVVRSQMAENQLSFDVDMPEEPIYIEGDAERLQQVQVNLLVNAAKYTPGGGHVRLSVEQHGDQALVTVTDSGTGLTPELLNRVFEPFVQSDQTLDRSDGGMGIGLTLVRSLVELHSGTVEARSEGPGSGCEFTVRLPLSEMRPQEAAAEADGDRGVDPRQYRLLLVEDNADARKTLRMLLEIEGYQISDAADGLEAVEAILEQRPDISLVDIGLPHIDGYEVARRVRAELGDDIYLIALTGYGQSSDKQRAREAGFDQHLTKPVDLARLREVLQRIPHPVSRR